MTLMLNKANARGLSPRHVLIVFTAALLCFVCSGMVFNTWSIFVVPVSTSLDVSISQFTLNTTLIFLSCALVASPMGNIMEKYDLRIPLGASAALCGLGFLVASCADSVWHVYIAGIIEGLGVCAITYLSAPTLINRWFNVHMGFLVGLCVAMMGAGGATWAMIGGFLIADVGWRTTYLIFSVVIFVVTIPAIVLFVRSWPKDVGLTAYGTEHQPNVSASLSDEASAAEKSSSDTNQELLWGVSARKAFCHPAFYTLAIAIALFNGTAQAGNLFPTYIYHLGDMGIAAITPAIAVIAASIIAMCMQVMQAVAKVTLGIIADKTILVALCLACGLGVIGILCVWQGVLISDNLIYIGAGLFGFLYGATNVLGPTLTRQLFGSRDYTKIYSRIATVMNITPAIGATGFAVLAEMSWDLEFSITLALIVTIFVFSIATIFLGRNIQQTLEARDQSK